MVTAPIFRIWVEPPETQLGLTPVKLTDYTSRSVLNRASGSHAKILALPRGPLPQGLSPRGGGAACKLGDVFYTRVR